MLEIRCVNKLRDKNNVIYAYSIQDNSGRVMNVSPEQLKKAIANKQAVCLNLTLTSDGRLVDKSETTTANQKVVNNKPKLDSLSAASIFGVSVKNVKKMRGREGYFSSGTVYYCNTKLGYWSQDDHGGSDWFDFNESLITGPLRKYNEYKNTSVSTEIFMTDLLILNDYLKSYKKVLKENKKYLVVIADEYGIYSASFSANEIYSKDGKYLPDVDKLITKASAEIKNKSPYGEIIEVKVFSSLNDFVIE